MRYILAIAFLASACDAGNFNAASCAGHNISYYRAGNDIYKYIRGNGAISISRRGITADSDSITLPVKSDSQGIYVEGLVYIPRQLDKLQTWSREVISCKKYNTKGLYYYFRCVNLKSKKSIDFKYSTDKGVVSFGDICEDCTIQNSEVLVSKFGLGNICQFNYK